MDYKRNIWFPKLTVSKLKRLLEKFKLTDDELEDLHDFKYFLIQHPNDAYEKGFYKKLDVDGFEPAYVLVNKFWLTNIEDKIKDFKTKYNISI